MTANHKSSNIITQNCPCCSGQVFHVCCQPLLDKKAHAASALALMRSRFTAFSLGRLDYINDTQKPNNTTYSNTDTASKTTTTEWLKLEIIRAPKPLPPYQKATVTFKAYYKKGGIEGVLHEKSSFCKFANKWYYIKGKTL
ncbi:MAG: YchJ family metal-binding protein [Pseudomonadota bacterium]|nr:YchJ family metal-binding protein [Pseudomonadota bacterium]